MNQTRTGSLILDALLLPPIRLLLQQVDAVRALKLRAHLSCGCLPDAVRLALLTRTLLSVWRKKKNKVSECLTKL